VNARVHMKHGIYRHYKGGLYEVVGIATESDTEEDVVVYTSVVTGRLFTRRKIVFEEIVRHNDVPTPRFEYVPEDSLN
jgi:hypothetical protein